jgi:hypothetical protein
MLFSVYNTKKEPGYDSPMSAVFSENKKSPIQPYGASWFDDDPGN